MLRTMEGLERVEMAEPGYAVEYDHIDPRALEPTLGVRAMPGLYLCRADQRHDRLRGGGRARAGRRDATPPPGCSGRAPAPLDRGQSYIAVMIDDLACTA